MARDYKDRVPGTWKRRSRRRRNGWLWVVPAVIVTGGVVLAVWRLGGVKEEPGIAISRAEATSPPRNDDPSAAPEPKKAKTAGKDDTKTKTKAALTKKPDRSEKIPDIQLPEPRFTFYKILPEKEVIVSESEIRNLARDEKAGKTAVSGTYMIQAGSFATLPDAERLKARLAEIRVKAKMEKVMIENGTWYRVKIGPYNSLIDAEKMRAHLRQNKVDSVLQQSKAAK